MPQVIGQAIIDLVYWIAGASAEAATAAGTATVVGSVTVAEIVGTVALTGLSFALTPGLPDPAVQKVNIRQSVSPRRRGYGITRLGGTMSLLKRSTVTGDGILYMDVMTHSGEITEVISHWVTDLEVRLAETSSLSSFSGITDVTFPLISDPKPWADFVVISAVDPGYVLPPITANYVFDGVPVSLDAISAGVVGGKFVNVVFPYTAHGKPSIGDVTFTIGGGGTGAIFTAISGDGLWPGGASPTSVEITDPGIGYTDTVGGYGFLMRARPNGHHLWDGGTGRNIVIDVYGVGYTAPTITATWEEGSSVVTLDATDFTLGYSGSASLGQVIYPSVFVDNTRVSLDVYRGTDDQVSDPLLQAAFPGGWTDKHRLLGIAHTVLKLNGVALDSFSGVYRSGIPTYTQVAKLSKVWDPRVTGQSADDPSTWEWSDNAALVIMDYLWHQDGMRLPRSLIELGIDAWIAAADYADEQVSLISCETEARYRLWGAYNLTDEPKTVLSKMLVSVDGRLRMREDGAIVLDLGGFDCPTGCETITDKDILAYDGLGRGPKKTELKNEIRATYLSPGHNYIEQDADPWQNTASIEVDGIQTTTLDLTWCPSHRQARQRMKVEAYRLNPEWQGRILTNAVGLRLLGKRYARFIIDSLGLDETFFIKRSEINLLKGVCTFEVISFPSEAYAWNPALEEGVSPENDTPGVHGIAVPAGATSVKITVDGGGGGGSETNGGGGGARAVKTVPLDPADVGVIFQFTVGAGGTGQVFDSFNIATDGEASTVTGIVASGTVSMLAGGGKRGVGPFGGTAAGGTATGGDTNTSGSGTHTDDGGDGASGAPGGGDFEEGEVPGGGGHRQYDGGNGAVVFEWTY